MNFTDNFIEKNKNFSGRLTDFSWPEIEDEVKYRMGDAYSRKFKLGSVLNPSMKKPYYIMTSRNIIFAPPPEKNWAQKVKRFQALLKKYDLGDLIINFFPGDAWRQNIFYPIFSHSRLANNKNCILWPDPFIHRIGAARFGSGIGKLDVSWEEKINKAIWRGTPNNIGKTKRANRLELVEKYFNDDQVNVSFSIKNLNKNRGQNRDKYEIFKEKGYLRDFVPMEEQLKYKYIIVVQGNDVASNLTGALRSNSLVLTPDFHFESIVEFGLKPYEHYIPLANDFSDLKVKIEWCIKNDEKCKEISKKATNFISRLYNKEREEKIRSRAMQVYKNNFLQ